MTFERKRYRIAIDTGGTFVDAVEFDERTGKLSIAKARTTPSDPSIGVMNALRKLGTSLEETYMIIHGTTLGINAIIQRKGAKVGIITNDGFKDILEIGRGDVPSKYMYDFNYLKPPPIVKRRYIRGVPCRVNYKGEVIKELDESPVEKAIDDLIKMGIESLAICFLHSYANPIHEVRCAEIISAKYPDIQLSLSSETVREYREYERMSTTVLEAYIKPIVGRYLKNLEKALYSQGFKGVLFIMRSDGGIMTVSTAVRNSIYTVQSGPAGGVVGATYYSQLVGKNKIISMDMGGTSLDVCIVENGSANIIHQTQVEHYPLLLSTYDIRSIGAGGGSIASISAGLLRVGPESAGADPGPMCYDMGGNMPTLTDAAVCLGYIDPKGFLEGSMPLRKDLAEKGVERLAKELQTDIVDAAAGIFKVTLANSISAVRQVTIEEGLDPEEFSILAFGGAGPMIAPILAHEMDIPEVIIPIAPAAFSAWGMLMSDIKYEISQTYVTELKNTIIDELEKRFISMENRVNSMLIEQNLPYIDMKLIRSLEVRYVGQEHTLEIQINNDMNAENIKRKFNILHMNKYGHKMDYPLEIVNLRVKGIGVLDKPQLYTIQEKRRTNNILNHGDRIAYCLVQDKLTKFDVYHRAELTNGDLIEGPAIIDEGVSTTVIHTGQVLTVDKYGNLIIRV